jgi:hypothetical protein
MNSFVILQALASGHGVSAITTHASFLTANTAAARTNALHFFQVVKEQPNALWSKKPDLSHTQGGVAEVLSLYCLYCLGALELVEVNGIEPMTPCLQSRCSPS